MTDRLLNISHLKTHFYTSIGVVRAVDGINLEIGKNETVGLVGESGSGKSVTALSVMRVIPPPGKIVEGEILFEGEDLLKKTERQMRAIRGGKIAMTFQDPMTYLNPVIRVGEQLTEAIMLHEKVSKSKAMKKAVDALETVRIASPADRVRDYPHQLSGGMRQRVLIAMSICCNPRLLIADEPTTALDVITQGEIIDLMKDLRSRLESSVLIISHDMGIVAELADYVAVMYAGKIAEYGDSVAIFKRTGHPYTAALLDSIPRVDVGRRRLKTIDGSIPDLVAPPSGCRFHPRCPYANEICRREVPELSEVERGHSVACWHYDDLKAILRT